MIILSILLISSILLNAYLYIKLPVRYVKIKEQLPGVWAHKLKTKKF